MERTTYKYIQNTLLFFTILVLSAVLYIEYSNDLEPCPLCIMQRMSAFVIGFLCFLSIGVSSLRRVKVMAIFQVVFAILGLYFAARQLWLQSLPVGEGKMCMPGLDVMQHYLSLSKFLKTYFWGAADCSEITWRGLGLTMPAWALIYFIIMAVSNISLLAFLEQKLDRLSK